MKIKLWGTRGSLPRPTTESEMSGIVGDIIQEAEKTGISTISELKEALKKNTIRTPLVFGGHTTCTEITHGKHSFLVDMGTGLTDAGAHAMTKGQSEFIIFQTHLHWDHIMGLPFFIPTYMPSTKIIIYHVHPIAPEYIKIQFNGINFPVKWEQLGAVIEFRQLKLYETVSFDGGITVSPFKLDHPGGAFGYRFEANGQSIAIGADGEYKRLTPDDLGNDLKYFQNLDLLTFDAQYEMNELANRFDWGHCTPTIGIDLALREGIRNLIFIHHDPRASEKKVFNMLEISKKHLKQQLPAYKEFWEKLNQPDGPNLYSGYDGLELDLDNLLK